MAHPDLTPGQLPHKDSENTGKVFSVTHERQEAILFTSDDIFIKKIFETDPRKAFELLFKKYYSFLCNHAVRFVYSKQKAQDIVADAFVLFWNSQLYTKVKGTYRSYLFAAVRNKCCTYLKWELKKELAEELTNTQIQSFYPSPEQIMQASDLHIKIEQTIKALPPRQQQVFVMSRFEGLKNNQIAETLNLSLKTVEMHISKSLAIFRMVLKE